MPADRTDSDFVYIGIKLEYFRLLTVAYISILISGVTHMAEINLILQDRFSKVLGTW